MRISDWSSDVCSSDLGRAASGLPMMGKAAWVPEEFPGDVRVLTGSGSARSQDASPKVTLSRRLRPFRAMPTQRASGAHCRDLTRAQRAPVHAPNTVVFAGTIAKQRCDMNSIID